MKSIVIALVALGLAGPLCAAEKVPPPGLIRGVMTDNVKSLTDLGANCGMLWGPPGKPAVWDTLAEAKIYAMLASLGPEKTEFFELDGKKRVRMTTPYCWSNDFGSWWVEHVAEAAAKKYPAACNVTPDEFQWNNGIIPYLFHVSEPVGTKFYCDCEKCKAAVGGKLPNITASRFLDGSPESRAYVEYRYKAVAKAMQATLDAAKKADPDFVSWYDLNLKEVMNYERYPSGIALDMLPQADLLLATCFQTSCDRRGDETRFLPAITTKYLLAARPRLGAVPALAATVYRYDEKQQWTEDYYWRPAVEEQLPKAALESIKKDLAPYKMADDEVILPSLSCLAHGAKGVMFFGEDNKEALKKLFALMAKLEKPLEGAQVPGEVVVLVSRILEDDWMLSHPPKVGAHEDLTNAMVQSGCWAQPADRIAWEFSKTYEGSIGFRSTQNVMSGLIKLGIPFRVQFAESPNVGAPEPAKAVIIPFGNSISPVAVKLVGEGPRRGKLIAMTLLDGDPNYRKLPEVIGDVFDVHATCASEDVERAWLKIADGGVALFLINWSKEPQNVNVSLPGKAKATMLDLAGGSTEIAPACVASVPAREARVILQSGR